MTERTMAIIVSVCKHCGKIVDGYTEDLAENGYWEKPKIGAKVSGDIITKVDEVTFRSHSAFRGYVIELDTRIKPHCDMAKRASD